MIDLGIVRPGSTIYIPFATYDSNDPSASVTLTGLAATDIEVYKDGGTTQRASDNGYTLLDTDGIDFDTVTGIHGFSIDLADNSTAGFWAAGSQYWVVVASITVDAATVNFIAATFRIGYPTAVLNTTIATLASQTSFTLTSGPAEDDALNGMWAMIHDVASAVQASWVEILDYTGSTKTVTLAAGATFTAAATDNISIMAPSPMRPTTTGRTLDVSAGGEAGVDWANVGSPTTTVGLSGTTVKTATDVETDTADIQARLPAALVSGRIDASVGAMATGVVTDAAIAADAITDAKVASDVTIASVTGSVGSVVGAVGSVTGAVGSVTGNVGGNVTGSVGSVATGGITSASFAAGAIDAAAIAANAIGASELAADAVTEIQAGLSTHSAADVWAAGTRTLTSAANITSTGGTTVPQTGDSFARLGAPAGVSIAADIANVDNLVLTTALTESYAADGAAPTLAQAVFAIQQFLQEKSISGTTLTVKKLDGTTTAMSFTLNDATTPTSVTRAS